jgi:hypothetical protein
MNRGPRPGAIAVDYVAKARGCWAPKVPDWIEALAGSCAAIGAQETAKRLQYSPSVVSQVLSKNYGPYGKGGDLDKFEPVVRGALMGSVVVCPVLDEIGRDRCRQEQARPFVATNSTRARLRRACKTCEHREVKS